MHRVNRRPWTGARKATRTVLSKRRVTRPLTEGDLQRFADRDGLKLTPSVLEELKRRGFSQSDIAEIFGVSRQYVSKLKLEYGLSRTPREVALDAWPWGRVPTDHTRTSPYKRLRDHAEYMATGGKGMTFDQLRRLQGFYDKLRTHDWVVEYHPDNPPSEDINTGGFAYRSRKPSDGELIIRVNEVTHLTDEARRVWVFPPRDPERTNDDDVER